MAAKTYRWLHGGRIDILNMVKVWNAVIPDRGALWGIPDACVRELVTLTNKAETILAQACSGERNAIITAECERVFGELKAKMRYIKKRYFLSPPLVDEDYPALLLHSHTHSSSSIAVPDAIPGVTWSFPSPGQAESTHIGPTNGRSSVDPRADEKVCYAFGLIGTGVAGPYITIAAVPATGAELPNLFFTRRKKHHFDFGQYRGMKLCVSYCYVNAKNESGPMSPVFEFTIP